MNNNLKVLMLFAENKERAFTIKKAAEALKMNYRIAYEEVMKLEKEGLITMTKHGNANVCAFHYTYTSKIVEIEEIRKRELFRNKDIRLVYKRVKEVKRPFYCLLLFGSYANKTSRKGSDIDLCLITDDPEVTREVQALLGITPVNVHLQDFTSGDFLAMLKSREFNVGNEIVKNNVILYGTEIFYRMVDDVKQ